MTKRPTLHSQISSQNEAITTQSEKQFTSRATRDAFEEIYTNCDISVNQTFNENTGYLFDYPIRWLQDPSMNKRIAIRRLDVTPTSHSFYLNVLGNKADSSNVLDQTEKFDFREDDNLFSIMNYICEKISGNGSDGIMSFQYNTETNQLKLYYTDPTKTLGLYQSLTKLIMVALMALSSC